MSEQTKNRTGRPIQIGGHFTHCRHYRSSDCTRRTFHCGKYDAVKTSCEGCPTCPKCDSILTTYRLVQSRGRDCIHAEHDKSCIICGAFIEESLQLPLMRIAEHKAEGACQVHGCRHTAYEGHQHIEEVDGHQVSFLICESHRRRIKTWRLHPNKGEAQKPILLKDGQLEDNPAYRNKRSRTER